MASTSSVARKKVSTASAGVQTIGCSATLKEVFSTTGIPLTSWKARIKACSLGLFDLDTTCTRALPSTCVIDGNFSQARRLMPAADATDDAAKSARERLKAAEDQMKEARTMRISKRGLLYDSELEGLRRQVWAEEANQAQMMFTEKERESKPLTEEEELALTENKSSFDPDDMIQPPLVRRLQSVRSPTAVDGHGDLANIYRLGGAVQLYSGPTAFLPHPEPVSISDNAIVGHVGPATAAYQAETPLLKVIPLNDAATKLFRGVRVYDVPVSNLFPIPRQELDKARAAAVLTPNTPNP